MRGNVSLPLEVFCCYARSDLALCEELRKHLAGLVRGGLIKIWFDGDISPGADWNQEIYIHLHQSRIILLLISADFLASDYCYGREMMLALERHRVGETRVVPILLRAVDYIGTPFGTLRMLPSHAQPVTRWQNRDDAFEDIVKGIRWTVNDLLGSGTLPIRQVPSTGYLPYKGTLVLDDPLADNNRGNYWDEYEHCGFSQGRYYVKAAKEGHFYPGLARGDDFKDFAYEVKMTITQGTGRHVGGGVIFRSDNLGIKLYALTICIDGHYTLFRHVDGTTGSLLAGGGFCPVIHLGLNQTNIIAVVAKDSIFELYINEQCITRFTDNAYEEGKIGLFSYCGGTLTEAVFENAKVWV